MRGRGCFATLVCVLAGCARGGAAPAVPTIEIPVAAVAGPGLTTRAPEPETRGDRDEEPRAAGRKRKVEVEWHGSWWPATLLAPRGDKWLVHYDGYGADWDEIVGEDRIRELQLNGDSDPDPDDETDP